MNTRPCRRATSRIAARRAGCETASTARIAFVRGVIAFSMRPASMFAVPGPMPMNTDLFAAALYNGSAGDWNHRLRKTR